MANNFTQNDGIKRYGALLIPLDKTEENKPNNDAKEVTSFKGKLDTAYQKASGTITNAIQNPKETFDNCAKYFKDNRGLSTITSKFSGIAITQALIDGKITNQSALDYLFLGFAPALNQAGVALGYSGLNQLKDALANGTINVGALIQSVTKIQKGITDLKDNIANKEVNDKYNIIEFDLTISHNEVWQSETPDRRVQNGTTYSEVVHNLPPTFEIQAALNELNGNYSIGEFKRILEDLRNKKKLVKLVLGDEDIEDVILTSFAPTQDCTKSGMDYNLSFKRIQIGSINVDAEVTIQKIPSQLLVQENTGSLGSSLAKSDLPNIKTTQIEEKLMSLINEKPKEPESFMSLLAPGNKNYRN